MANTLRLSDIDALLARAPDNVDAHYLRAGLLAQAGRADEARAAYLATLALAPTHFGALNDLGSLLYGTDFRAAARTAYAEAVKHHPNNPIGHINLANALLADGQMDQARAHYETALMLAPDHPDAHQGMANLLQQLGQADAAEAHRQQSHRDRSITALPYRGAGPPRRVLLLVSAAGGNVPTRFLLDEMTFEVFVLAVEAHAETSDSAAPRPGVQRRRRRRSERGGAGRGRGGAGAHRLPGDQPAQPSGPDRPSGRRAGAGRPARRGRAQGRARAARRARTGRRRELRLSAAAAQSGLSHRPLFPERVETPDDLPAALASACRRRHPADPVPWTPATRDGLARKYRVMMIGGKLYPLHLAISDDWKVHYFTADMAERPDHRAEEAAFLTDMPGVLGERAMAGRAAIAARLGLDYGGVDFGVTQEGDVLLFEANATMVIAQPDADPRWDYRRAPVAAILAATRAMLLERAGGTHATPAPRGHHRQPQASAISRERSERT